LNGKPFVLKVPAVLAIKRVLNKISKDEYFTSDVLAKMAGLTRVSVQNVGLKGESISKYTMCFGKYRYWGSPTAIAALRKQAGDSDETL
jgi:hypothetical protein